MAVKYKKQKLVTSGTRFNYGTIPKNSVKEYVIPACCTSEPVPLEYCSALPRTSQEQEQMIRVYFIHLYPEESVHTWLNMGATEIINKYKNLDFWYLFNNADKIEPYPILLDDLPVSKWLKKNIQG